MVGLTEDGRQSVKLVHYTCIHIGTYTSTEDFSKLHSDTGISELQTNSQNTVQWWRDSVMCCTVLHKKGGNLLKNEKLFMMNTLFPFKYSEIELTHIQLKDWRNLDWRNQKMEEKPGTVLFIYTAVKSPTISWEFCTAFEKIPNCFNVDCIRFIALWTLSYCNRTFLVPFPLFYTVQNTIKPILQEIIRTFPQSVYID